MSSTAWLYCVVSSGPQKETLADQEAWGRTTADANGWPISRVFSNVTTGKHGVRKALIHLVAELRAAPVGDRPARVLMLRLDRVGRGSIVDSMIALREMEQLGVVIHTRERGDEGSEGPDDELVRAVRLSLARFENAVRREKSVAFHARKRAAGEYGSIPPYGFVFLEKRLAPYEPEAAIVRALYERRVAGFGYQRLAQFAAATAPPKIRPNGESRKMTWGTSTVTRILSSPRYRGTIVSASLWDDVERMRGGYVDRATRWPWPLRGAVRCTCGAALLGEASGHPGRRTRYYVCRRFNQHRDPSYPHHRAEALEAQFLEVLRNLRRAPGAAPYAANRDLPALRKRRAAVARQRSEIDARRSRAWALAEDGTVGKDEFARRLEDLAKDADRLGEELRAVDREIGAAEARERNGVEVEGILERLADLWAALPVGSQRDVARAISIYVGGFWADPNRPGELLVAAPDGSGKSQRVETIGREPDYSAATIEVAIRRLEDLLPINEGRKSVPRSLL